jgi:hypothetical protein
MEAALEPGYGRDVPHARRNLTQQPDWQGIAMASGADRVLAPEIECLMETLALEAFCAETEVAYVCLLSSQHWGCACL